MKIGTRIIIETPVFTELGFLRPSTEGNVIWDIGNNMYCCKFLNASIQTKTGEIIQMTVIAAVHPHQIQKVPARTK